MNLREGKDTPPVRIATHYDPSSNDVSDPYMPIDLTARRSQPGHFIKYEGTEQVTIDWLGDNFIPISFEVPHDINARGIVTIELRDELDRIDLELLRIGAQVTAAYGPLRGLNDRLARLEAWREAF